MIGTHAAYDLRYPSKFAIYAGDKGLDSNLRHRLETQGGIATYNHYDNAVVYHDYVLGRIFRSSISHEVSTVTYLSDHGDAVGETSAFFGHAEGVAPKQIYEVPL